MATVDLTPGQALILLDPNKMQGREAVKVSLMWLLARRYLIAKEQTQSWLRGKSTTLWLGTKLPDSAPSDLRSLVGLVKTARFGSLTDVIKSGRKVYGSNLDRFRTNEILPGLMQRLLVKQTTEPFLFVFKRRRYVRTASGDQMCRQIESKIIEGSRIPHFLDANPAQAAAMAATLGGLIFLVPELRSHFDRLAHAMRQHDSSGTATSDSGGSSSDTPTRHDTGANDNADHASGQLEQGGVFDIAGFNANNLDGIRTSLDAFDSGFDFASSDGGSSDSGGDGGGAGGGD